ncbi:MAG: 6,7-dimethyl-8-ribityllumazine synthase, partial [Deltaproteobacteria bacterium HGW-Deltaproteobacteria-16]
MPKFFEGKLQAEGKKFGIVIARFNSFIAERLLEGALDTLMRSGVKDKEIEVARVPGAF